jgi:hypothetical protein
VWIRRLAGPIAVHHMAASLHPCWPRGERGCVASVVSALLQPLLFRQFDNLHITTHPEAIIKHHYQGNKHPTAAVGRWVQMLDFGNPVALWLPQPVWWMCGLVKC